ncbi:unnamed protein product [Cyberlindnera jadinii]|uniref:SH3 domain-containing protein n=1 Tax=Cyberlindnera jadinii (strain ATCC 18201 / CBS 1600 / BCRC 20928 / JCM 3617 / NBRC 0987 / NRRL Y-1542) TaxID=983966 RepID=A0A0H5BZU8_CYBJN|nr:unnamed protein product [Cyberlindnera jadinii]
MSSQALPFLTKALYAYKSDYEDDLNFEAGQLVKVTGIEDDEWFSGEYTDDNGQVRQGMFPKNFVGEPIEETTSKSPAASSALEVEADQENEEEEPEEKAAPQQGLAAVSRGESESVHHTEESEPKKLQSKATTFSSDSGIPLPTAKIAEQTYAKKSYQGVPSSYVPPPLNKKETRTFTSDLHHSSYVPPPLGLNKPKTETFDVPAPPPVVSSQDEPEEEQGPKLSLKERIALLQKQQAEEAERQAAALRKKAERAEESKKSELARKASIASATSEVRSLGSGVSHARAIEAEDVDSDEFHEAQEDFEEDERELSTEGVSHVAEINPAQEITDAQPVSITGGEREQEEEEEEEEAKDEEEEEEEEEEDSEEARRAALRDRMARLAGAGGMYGAGFNPFGGVPSGPRKSVTHSKKVKEEKEETYDMPAAIPIMPFATGSAPQLPEALQKSSEKDVELSTPDAATDDISGEQKQEQSADSFEAPSPVNPTVASVQTQSSIDQAPPIPVVPQSPSTRAAPPIPSVPSNTASPTSETKHTGNSLADKLANMDLSEVPKTLSESAIEGDDEQGGYSSDDDVVLYDRDAEKKQTTLPKIPDPVLHSDFGSEYNTGYESDEESTQHPPQAKTLDPKNSPPPPPPQIPVTAPIPPVPSAPAVPAAPPIPNAPAPGTALDQAPRGAPPIPSVQAPQLTSTPPPLPSAGHAPPPPPPAPTTEQAQYTPSPSGRQAPPPPPSIGQAPPPPPSIGQAPPPPPLATSSQARPKMPPPPPIPVPQVYDSLVEAEQSSDRSLPSSPTLPRVPPPPPIETATSSIPSSHSPIGQAPPVPVHTLRKASTFASETGASVLSRGEEGLELGTQWWLRQRELPPSLQARVGRDLIFEVDEHKVLKRGGRELILRDYYILHQNNSQTLISVSFEAQDPQGTLHVTTKEQDAPSLDPLRLESYAESYGVKVFQFATKLVNSTLTDPLVPYIISQIPGALPAVGLRSYGATIYSNNNNTDVKQYADFKPGDILAINKAKFQGHGKLHQKITYEVGFGGSPFAAVITEFDQEKRKFRVVEVDANGKVRHSSYKPTDMKSGKMKVFRVVGRDFVSW